MKFTIPKNITSEVEKMFDPRTDEEFKKYPYTYGWNRDTFRWNIFDVQGRQVLGKDKQVISLEDRDKAMHLCHGMNIDNAKSLGYKINQSY